MSPTRIVLPPKHKPFADELLQITGIDSLSNLFVVFLTRYGSHLRASWNISQPCVGEHFAAAPIAHSATPISVIKSQIYDQTGQITPDPKPEPEEPDPVIERLSGLIDTF
jgi:hypothetical protein